MKYSIWCSRTFTCVLFLFVTYPHCLIYCRQGVTEKNISLVTKSLNIYIFFHSLLYFALCQRVILEYSLKENNVIIMYAAIKTRADQYL